MGTLYKYVSADRILTCIPELGNGTLRATQPSALNDPFECHFDDRYSELEMYPGSGEDKDSWLCTILSGLNPTSPISKKDLTQARCKYGSLYLRQLLSEQVSRRFGVVSFSTDPYHPLMWAHYTIDASGFVIGYDKEALENLGGGEESLRQFEYYPGPPVIFSALHLNEKNLHTIMCAKGIHWEYESEWRLIVDLSETNGTGHEDQHCQPINVTRIPNSAVRSVFYTERTPEEKVNQIRARLYNRRDQYLAVTLKQLSLSKSAYRFE